MTITNLNQLRLTEKGERVLDSLSLDVEGESEMLNVLYCIDAGLNYPLGPYSVEEKSCVEVALRRRLAERDTFKPKYYIDKLPADVKGPLQTYYNIAHQLSVSDVEVEQLRQILLKGLREIPKPDLPPGARGALPAKEPIIGELEQAKTRSEKIIAIDAAMGYEHGAGHVLYFGVTPRASEEMFFEFKHKDLCGNIRKALSRLSE